MAVCTLPICSRMRSRASRSQRSKAVIVEEPRSFLAASIVRSMNIDASVSTRLSINAAERASDVELMQRARERWVFTPRTIEALATTSPLSVKWRFQASSLAETDEATLEQAPFRQSSPRAGRFHQ